MSQFSSCQSEPLGPRSDIRSQQPRRLGDHGSYLCLATAALAAVALLGLAGCQTPPQTAAPVYGSTVAPPATGMIGQPAPYGTVSAPPGTAFPQAPMPGPATTWQGVPQQPAPANSTWSWAQSGTPAAQQPATAQQYGSQLANQANQYQQSLSNQAQQFANQPQQMANQTQQSLANQQQQLQNAANQYTQGFNNQTQQYANQMQQNAQAATQQFNQQMQQANQQMQQAMPQMPTGPQQQTANGNWWPFSNTSAMPPARAVPAMPARY